MPDGTYLAGGTVTYSGLTASRLGIKVGILTSANPATPFFENVPSINVYRRASERTTVFENIYVDGSRRQYVRALAGPLTPDDLPDGWERTPIVHLGPMAQEIDPTMVEAFPSALLGLTPQGWLRHWDEQGLVFPVRWRFSLDVLGAADAVILSPEDVGYDEQQIDLFRRHSRLLVLTNGMDGAIVYQGGQRQRVPAYDVIEVDPTGAGDVFAAAFMVRLFETGDAIEAARFANCAASFIVQGVGTTHVPTREQVEWRMRHGSLRSQRGWA